MAFLCSFFIVKNWSIPSLADYYGGFNLLLLLFLLTSIFFSLLFILNWPSDDHQCLLLGSAAAYFPLIGIKALPLFFAAFYKKIPDCLLSCFHPHLFNIGWMQPSASQVLASGKRTLGGDGPLFRLFRRVNRTVFKSRHRCNFLLPISKFLFFTIASCFLRRSKNAC